MAKLLTLKFSCFCLKLCYSSKISFSMQIEEYFSKKTKTMTWRWPSYWLMVAKLLTLQHIYIWLYIYIYTRYFFTSPHSLCHVSCISYHNLRDSKDSQDASSRSRVVSSQDVLLNLLKSFSTGCTFKNEMQYAKAKPSELDTQTNDFISLKALLQLLVKLHRDKG